MSILPLWSKLLFVTASAVISASAAPQPGSVDPTFDPGRGPLGVGPGRGTSALIQPDGKILVTGAFTGVNLDFVPAVVRFNADGSLDSSFNASALPAPSNIYAPDDLTRVLALQPNGQVLVAGEFIHADGSIRYLVRLDADGNLDPTFNPRIEDDTESARVSQATILSGGRVLIGGRFDRVNGIARPYLARLNADGSLDETFQPAAASAAYVVQSSGKIVVATGDRQLSRLNSDGSRDHTFASAIALPGDARLGPVLVQPDDKLIITIHHGWFSGSTIRRLNADGLDDPTFQPFSSYGGSPLLVQNDGKLIIATFDGAAPSRLHSDGSPDWSFQPDALDYFVAQQSDGKLVTVGDIYERPFGIRRMFLDGSRDDSFAPGMGLTGISRSSIDRACLLPNGKVAIAGNFNYIDRTPRNRLAVLNSNGTLDASFDAGELVGSHSDGSSNLHSLAVQKDGKIFVGVTGRLVRLNPDGREDPTFHYTPSSSSGSAGFAGLFPDGKILLYDGDSLVRVFPDGTRDTSFQAAEKGTVKFVQFDGKIMIVGHGGVIRLNPDGSRDIGFSVASDTRGPFDRIHAMAIQPDGKYLVSRSDHSGFRDLFFRLNADGSNDASFSANVASVGLLAVDQTGINFAGNIAPQADITSRLNQLGVARFNFDGTRDSNFKPVEFNAGATLSQLLLQPDGQLIITGGFNQVNGVERNAVARLNGSAPKKLANISTRARVGAGQMVEIGGFIVAGNAPKKVIVRALGPSLGLSGLSESQVLANPSLELHDASGRVIEHNDDWRHAQEAEITASGIPPSENAESAIVTTLAPGHYTAVVQGRHGAEGIALAEVYDLDPASDSNLANISTRGFVGGDDEVMIAGFILRGSEPSAIVMRALGPSLSSSGITTGLSDPTLTVHDQSGSIIATNDDWGQTQRTELEAHGMGAAHDSESALIANLPPGPCTAIVRGANGETGVALVEVYHLN